MLPGWQRRSAPHAWAEAPRGVSSQRLRGGRAGSPRSLPLIDELLREDVLQVPAAEREQHGASYLRHRRVAPLHEEADRAGEGRQLLEGVVEVGGLNQKFC